jgi:uncharacterized protein YjbI with pentapeptide repeats
MILLRRLRGEESASPTVMLNELAERNLIEAFNLSDTVIGLDLALQGKTLRDGKLDRCDLDRSALTRCTLTNLSIQNASFRLAVVETSRFVNVVFDASDLTGSLFVDSEFGPGCTFSKCDLDDVGFKRCTFAMEALRSMAPKGARFISCSNLSVEAIALLESRGGRVEDRLAEELEADELD